MNNKPRVIKDYEKLDQAIQEQIKITYPHGYHKKLITFTNQEGKKVSALPFETDDRYYLVRMTVEEAKDIILNDDDYDDDGILKEDIQEEYEDKHEDVDYLDLASDEDNDDEDED